MPSYGGAHGPDGSKKSGDQGQGSRDRDGGQTGGDRGQRGSGFGGARFDRPANPFDSRMRNPRYAQNSIATRPATLSNIATAITGGIPTPSMLGKALVRGAISGSIDPYDGPVGKTTGFSYDGPDRARASDVFRPKMGAPTINPNQARAQALGQATPVVAPDWWRMPF